MIAGFGTARRVDVVVVANEVGCPLVRVALQETVEAFEPVTEGPTIERPGIRALAARHQVPFADRGRVVARVAQYARESGDRLWQPARVARIRHRHVGEKPHPDRVVIATREHAGA